MPLTADPPAPAPAPAAAGDALPAGAVPVAPAVASPAPAQPAIAVPPPANPEGGPYPVEQRVVSSELRTRHHDDPDTGPARPFLEVLPREMVEGVSFPLTYHLASTTGRPGTTVRVADSTPARAKGYTCVPFYKPISRCVGGGR